MIGLPRVSGVIVTRGDVPLDAILETHSPLAETVVWDNSVEEDLSVYGRYAALSRCRNDIVLVQDDDCLVPVLDLCAAHEPGVLVANMPKSRWGDYPDSALVGWGAILDRRLATDALARWEAHDFDLDDEDLIESRRLAADFPARVADVIVTTLAPHRKLDLGFEHLPWAEGPGRMFTADPHRHRLERALALNLARKARDA